MIIAFLHYALELTIFDNDLLLIVHISDNIFKVIL